MHEPSRQRLGSLPTSAGLMARLAYARARANGISAHPLLRRSGLTLAQIDDPRTRLSAQAQIRFLDLTAEAMNDLPLGFHLARDFDLRHAGLLYYVAASSTTLGEALRRVSRYTALANEGISIRCAREGHLAIRIHYVGLSRSSDRQQMEFWITALIRLCRELTRNELRPIRVRIAHRRDVEAQELGTFLGQTIEFGADLDEVEFSAGVGALPIISADPYLNDLLVTYGEEALARQETKPAPLRIAVENEMNKLLPHGDAQAGKIARALAMSPRTLARRLAAEGSTLVEIRENLRANLAMRYLREKKLSMSQIAWLLGYRETAAFTHACRRWTGSTPTEIRNQPAPVTDAADGSAEPDEHPLALAHSTPRPNPAE